ncbi:MAG: M3 family oligoendopeptidase [Candidatus Omnitrophica bacterium]|nr:M3 family oligoendopeptidase [Candidatus Omnitrophota bacterium]
MDLDQLPYYQKRSFVPEGVDLTDVQLVKSLYQQLEARNIESAQDLERWLMDRSELDASLSQAGSILYIRMTCQTDDAQRTEAYARFIQTVPPAVKPINDRLNHKYLKAQKSFGLDKKRYEVYERDISQDIKLFCEQNVPLQTQVDLLAQEYQTLSGAMTVMFEGRQQTLPQMAKYLQETDSALRQRAWQASAQRRLQDKDKFEEIFDKLFNLRNTIAQNAGYKSFIDYQFKAYHRFDYTPEDCHKYHQTIEKWIVPLNGKILNTRRQQMKLKSLRPWDTSCDPLGKKPLSPFKDTRKLIQSTGAIFNKLDIEFNRQFQEMDSLGLLDLENRKGKAPGGYQNTLDESRKPFIFMNAVGVDDDVRTLLHESGHAFHAMACASDPMVDYRHAPMEFCEVASMSMELLGSDYLSEFYDPEDVRRSNREHLEGIIQVLAWVANIDAFQHWLYEHPNHSHQERSLAWNGLFDKFGGQFIDWDGLSEIKSYLWHRQLHIFEVPFYYIEYGIAQLGALQVWLHARRNLKEALENYKRGLALGGSRPLRELFTTSGISFDFSEGIIKPLVEEVTREWEKLS